MDELIFTEEPVESLSHSVSYQYIAAAVQFISGFAFYLFLIRMYSTEIVGVFTMIQAINMLMPIIFTLGLPPGVQHMVSYYHGRKDNVKATKIAKGYIYFSLLLGVIALVVTSGLSPYLSIYFFHSYQYTWVIILLSISIALSIINLVLTSILMGKGRFRKASYVSIAGTSISYFSALFLFYEFKSIEDIIYGLILGSIISLIIAIVYVYPLLHIDIKLTHKDLYVGEMARYSMPLFFASILGYGAMYVDRFVVAFFINLSDLGIYNLALLIATSITFITTPFTNILITKFSNFYGENNKEKIVESVRISSVFISLVFVPVAVGIAALSPMIMYLIGGANYVKGALPLTIISLTIALFVNLYVLTTVMYGLKKTHIFLLSSAMAVISNIVFSIILIPRLNIIGASMSFSSTYIVSYIVLYYFARKEHMTNLDISTISKIWLSAAVMFVVVYDMEFFAGTRLLLLIPYIAIGALVFLFFVKFTYAIKKEDLDFFVSIIPEKFQFAKKIMLKIF
ncbi:MAG: polysaccharide biosynthesis C-terminal domain-containing protein [Thermoplasmata archaeon]